MQNVDPLWFVYPVAVIAFSFGLVIYWHYRRSSTWSVLLHSLLVYAGAIAAKVVFQSFTLSAVVNEFGFASVEAGIYFRNADGDT